MTCDAHRAQTASLLARANRRDLISLIDELLQLNPEITVDTLRPPETGTVQLRVREPVCDERFILADALVTVAEVSVNGVAGWAMRLGTDSEATVAAALADSFVAQPDQIAGVERVTSLVETTAHEVKEARRVAVRRALGTVIDFEELD